MSNELIIKDIEAGKVRTLTSFPHGYYADYFDTPESRQSSNGYVFNDAMLQASRHHNIPTFIFEGKERQLGMAGMMPIIRDYRNSLAPWASIDSVPAEVGHSILALGADKVENFTPVKLPLPLFSEAMQTNLIRLAQANGKENQLVQMPIRNARIYEKPSQYFAEVTSTIMPDTLRKITDHLAKNLTHIAGELDKIKDLKDEPGEMAIFSKKRSLESQIDLLENHFSTVNERILIGKANDIAPKQVLAEVNKAMQFENAGEKEVAKKYDKSTHPHVHAKAYLAERVSSFLEGIINIMSTPYSMR